mmetsp:Transcript_16473/g.23092  ORF Transcript_16473/g.23092 Transcript_16473/m.23092 type:complete len:282 (-) Transcript_16473:78-923(-)
MRAAVLGGTGQVGRRLIVQLLSSQVFTNGIASISRSRLYPLELAIYDKELDMRGLQQYMIGKNPTPEDLERDGGRLVKGCTHAFCVIGAENIRRRTAFSQQTEQERRFDGGSTAEMVDRDLAFAFAKICKDSGTVGHFSILSQHGADPCSEDVILRAKGECEELINELDFPAVTIYQPRVILGTWRTSPTTEKVHSLLGSLLPSHLKGIKAVDLAKVMCRVAEATHVEVEKDGRYLQDRWGDGVRSQSSVIDVSTQGALTSSQLYGTLNNSEIVSLACIAS